MKFLIILVLLAAVLSGCAHPVVEKTQKLVEELEQEREAKKEKIDSDVNEMYISFDAPMLILEEDFIKKVEKCLNLKKSKECEKELDKQYYARVYFKYPYAQANLCNNKYLAYPEKEEQATPEFVMAKIPQKYQKFKSLVIIEHCYRITNNDGLYEKAKEIKFNIDRKYSELIDQAYTTGINEIQANRAVTNSLINLSNSLNQMNTNYQLQQQNQILRNIEFNQRIQNSK